MRVEKSDLVWSIEIGLSVGLVYIKFTASYAVFNRFTKVVLPSVQRVIDENDKRLKGLKKDYREDVHRVVANLVEHSSPQSYGTSPRAEKLLYKKELRIF
ncbi:hypothetical protein Tco_0732445 [Tanacetum coccineum]